MSSNGWYESLMQDGQYCKLHIDDPACKLYIEKKHKLRIAKIANEFPYNFHKYHDKLQIYNIM